MRIAALVAESGTVRKSASRMNEMTFITKKK